MSFSSRALIILCLVVYYGRVSLALTEGDCEDCCNSLVLDYANWQPDEVDSYGGTCTGACATAYRVSCEAGCRGPVTLTDMLACSGFQNQCDAGIQWINQGFTTETFAQIPPDTQRFCAPGGILSVTPVPTQSPIPPTIGPTSAPSISSAPTLNPTKAPTKNDALGDVLPVAIGGAAFGVLVIALAVVYVRGGGKGLWPGGGKNRVGSHQSYVTEHYIPDEIKEVKDDDESTYIPYIPPSVALSVFSEAQSTVYGPIDDSSYRVTHDFLAENPDELSAAKNTKVQGVRQVNEHWYLVRNEDGLQGMIPISYLEEEVDDESVVPYDIEQSVRL